MYVESIFFIFNKLWETSFLAVKPFIPTYRVFPSGNLTGFVEFVSDSTTLQSFDWNILDDWDDHKKNDLVCSAAASFVGSFILGVRDRHQDNMMITNHGHFLHIDFGYLFNQKTWFDANRFAIPSKLKQKLTAAQWASFVDLCGDAFVVLRRHQGMLTTIITNTFKQLYTEEIIVECLSHSFYSQKTESSAKAHLLELVRLGEVSGKKKIKNLAHNIESSESVGRFIPKS
eukprot:TRINITY_DN5883_c0_g6_i1.p1 TRINITY_DN5883_c0_g6~~TRINITY_DN5883_c0_g6_i1.p1  ORF type:complete len:230 (+),score=51.41 TRINITY_DN5883_c0_g6_i1:709-1398(+)